MLHVSTGLLPLLCAATRKKVHLLLLLLYHKINGTRQNDQACMDGQTQG